MCQTDTPLWGDRRLITSHQERKKVKLYQMSVFSNLFSCPPLLLCHHRSTTVRHPLSHKHTKLQCCKQYWSCTNSNIFFQWTAQRLMLSLASISLLLFDVAFFRIRTTFPIILPKAPACISVNTLCPQNLSFPFLESTLSPLICTIRQSAVAPFTDSSRFHIKT